MMEELEALHESFPGLVDLRESFLHGGGSEAEWIDVLNRPGLEAWARNWMKAGEPEASRDLEELVKRYFKRMDLIEYAVRTDDNVLTGYALASVVEAKVSRHHVSLKVRHLHSNDPDFESWASLHLGPDPDFHLHICKKKVGTCTAKPTQKDLGWFHVSCFRLLSYLAAFLERYHPERLLAEVKAYAEVYLEEILEERREKEIKLTPRAEQAGELEAPEVARVEDARARPGVAKARDPGKDVKAALKAASSKAGDQGRKGDRGGGSYGGPAVARDVAAQASAALGARHPQMVDLPQGPGSRRNQGDKARGGGLGDWLDNISLPGEDERYPDPPEVELPLEDTRGGRRQRHELPEAAAGGYGGPPDEKRGRRRKRKKRGSRSSSSGRGRDGKKASASKPNKGDKKKKRNKRSGGDPSDSSGSSSADGGDKRPRRGDWLGPSAAGGQKKKRKKKKKKSADSSSSGDGSSKSEDGFYGKGASRYESLAEKARRHPGRLLRSGLEQMAKYVAARGGDGHEAGVASWRDQRVGAYLNQVLFTQHAPEKIGVRNVRELVTISEAIDLLMENNLPAVGDVLMQRMKALESSLTEGWQMAAYQELIPPSRASLTTDMERSFAAKQALQMKKLQESMRPKRG